MLRRFTLALVGATLLVTQTGCHNGPLGWLRHKLCCPHCHRGGEYFCGSGCGQCYYNEWHNDPPDECDPCNRCGDYTGRGDCGCGCGHH